MAVNRIPVDPTRPNHQLQVTLDGVNYVLAFKWNTREVAWYFTIADENEDPIVEGIKVVLDYPLNLRTADARRPLGVLIAYDTTGEQVMPGETDLGARVELYYYDLEELQRIDG